jgi:hypothetical protein
MQKLLTWLKSHPLIKIRELERDAGVPRGALNKALHGEPKYLSPKHKPKLVDILNRYGFK